MLISGYKYENNNCETDNPKCILETYGGQTCSAISFYVHVGRRNKVTNCILSDIDKNKSVIAVFDENGYNRLIGYNCKRKPDSGEITCGLYVVYSEQTKASICFNRKYKEIECGK